MNATTTVSSAQARRLAEKWLDTVRTLKDLEMTKQNIEAELRDYVRETGEQTIGNVMAYERAKPPKLETTDGKKLDTVLPFLLAKLPGQYTKVSADVAQILKNYELDREVRRILTTMKVQPAEQEKEIYFKHI
jgi:hypothetical protein